MMDSGNGNEVAREIFLHNSWLVGEKHEGCENKGKMLTERKKKEE